MIDRDQVLHVARLARLELTEDELERMAGELSTILEHVERMNELQLEGVEPTSHVVELENVLRKRSEAGESTVLLIDEAQSLPRDILEEIRLLANIETSERKLLSVIMAGQPEVTSLLNDDSLRQLKQRVALRCELRPLTLQETAGYIAGRIRSAGGLGAQVFTREAVTLIHERSRGIPRTISVICDNALLTGFAIGQRPINSATVREVCRDFDLSNERDEPPGTDTPLTRPQPPSAEGTSGGLIVMGVAKGETRAPAAEPADAPNQPPDGSPRELYGTTALEPKRRTFSFLRG